MTADNLTDQELYALVRRAYRPGRVSARAGEENDFRGLRTLARVLALASEEPATSVFAERQPSRRRAVAAASGGLVAGAVAATVALLGSSAPALAQKFPVFAEGPHARVEANRAALGFFQQEDADIGTAKSIFTPHGQGYVTTAHNERDLCVAIPATSLAELRSAAIGRRADGSKGTKIKYVGGCYSTAAAEGKGLVLTLPGRKSIEAVAILPTGASRPTLRSHGSVTPLRSENGVATVIARSTSVLEYRVNEMRVSTTLAPGTSRAKLLTPER